jgi:uncharacterized protein YaaR (DUF327 family)
VCGKRWRVRSAEILKVPDISTGAAQSINPFLTRNLPDSAARMKKNRKADGGGKLLFSSFLREKDAGEAAAGVADDFSVENADLNGLLDDVHSCGDALKKCPFPDEIQQYKRAVKRFMQFVVHNTFDVKNEQVKIRGKEKVYTSVTVIDQKLESLAAKIMASQGEKLDILTRVHEINGLLVDLLK